MPKKGFKRSFAFAFSGNAFFFICQWAMGVMLAKLGTPAILGQFAYAQAICIPVFVFSQLQLKAVLVSDARDEYVFGHYFTLRIVTSLIAMGICVTVALLIEKEWPTKCLVMAVALNQATFAVRDIIINMSVKQERLELYARSQFIQGFLSLTLFATVFWFTHNLLLSIGTMVLGRVFITIFNDGLNCRRILAGLPASQSHFWRPTWGKLARLAWMSAPLGVIMGLISWRTYIPRLVLESHFGEDDLGYYSAISMLLVALNMIYNSTGQTVSPRLARYYAEERIREFKLLLGKLLLVCLSAGLLGVLGAFFLGKDILRILFTPAYAEYSWLLVLMMTVGTLYGISNAIGYGVTATRAFREQLWPNILGTSACLVAAYILIPRYGIAGTVYTLMLATTVSTVGLLIVLVKQLRRATTKDAGV